MRENLLWKALYMICALSGILAGYGMFTLAGKTVEKQENSTKENTLVQEEKDGVFFDWTEKTPVPDVELNSAEPPVPDGKLNLAELPTSDADENLVEPPVPDGKGNSAELSVSDGKGNLVELSVPDGKENSEKLSVPDGKLNLAELPASDADENSAELSVPDGKENMAELSVSDGKGNLVELSVPDGKGNSAEPSAMDTETNSAERVSAPTQTSAQTDTTIPPLATEAFTCPVEIFGQVPEFTPSDEFVSYFEFAYELVNLCEPLIKERELNLNALLAKFVVKAFFCGVDVERLDINAPIPRRLAALCLWLAAKVLEEEGCDTRAQNAGKYVTDAGNCSRSEKKALVYLYEQRILEGDSQNRRFYPEEGLRTESAAHWLARIKECWN